MVKKKNMRKDILVFEYLVHQDEKEPRARIKIKGRSTTQVNKSMQWLAHAGTVVTIFLIVRELLGEVNNTKNTFELYRIC